MCGDRIGRSPLPEFMGWQGDLQMEPMLFLFLHTYTHGWFEQRFLVFVLGVGVAHHPKPHSVRHKAVAQHHSCMSSPTVVQDLLAGFRTCRNAPVFVQDLPPVASVGLPIKKKR